MLFTYALFLLCACIAIASPWNGNHYNRHHQHLTERASSDSINLAALPVVAPAPFTEKMLASRQSDDEEDDDECSDEDEADEDDSTRPQAAQAAPSQASTTFSAATSSTATPPAANALYHVAGAGNPSVPFNNATFPAAQVIAASTTAAAPAPSPPTSDEYAAPPVLPNLPVSSATVASSAPSAAPAGGTLIASFTRYGAGDQDGSGNCNTATAACGFYNNPGYNAAISQALFGVGPGAGAGPACGTCYKLMPDGGNSIVVKVNNLCPDAGNPLCSYSVDKDVNFDLCMDDGAGPAMFGTGPQQLNGTAVEVDCSQWSGSADLTSTS
ncbi:hypothetical protein JMJ35_001915 [Cladonia borealis]|uniref:Expansin-like EG45 domain-containing protein n=1 Tax=Cladonia borealis TaxID=184061 RepID=A0AA39R878_9LECA|nr:hypothetical protein JMJ35_001915 [Cladonia borealis]